MRILIADDSEVMRRMLTNCLNLYNKDDLIVDAVDDGSKVLTALANFKYNLIVLDINMPVLSGIDTLKAIRFENINIPVLMCSVEGEKKYVIQALRLKANDYICKPVDKKVFLNKVNKLLYYSMELMCQNKL